MGASSSYEKLEHLGQGSFGAVYKVKRRESQQVFAMKEVKRTDPTAENEIEILKMVRGAGAYGKGWPWTP
jgi:serine/threonine protein kinase